MSAKVECRNRREENDGRFDYGPLGNSGIGIDRLHGDPEKESDGEVYHLEDSLRVNPTKRRRWNSSRGLLDNDRKNSLRTNRDRSDLTLWRLDGECSSVSPGNIRSSGAQIPTRNNKGTSSISVKEYRRKPEQNNAKKRENVQRKPENLKTIKKKLTDWYVNALTNSGSLLAIRRVGNSPPHQECLKGCGTSI